MKSILSDYYLIEFFPNMMNVIKNILITIITLTSCSSPVEKAQKLSMKWLKANTVILDKFEPVGFGSLDTAYWEIHEYMNLEKYHRQLHELERELREATVDYDSSLAVYNRYITLREKDFAYYAESDTFIKSSNLRKVKADLSKVEKNIERVQNQAQFNGFKMDYVIKVRDADNLLTDTTIVFYFDKELTHITSVDTQSIDLLIE